MSWYKSLSYKYKLMFLSGISIAGFIAFGALTYTTLNQVKVNGPVYTNIVQGKDIIADILPPPLFIVESQLIVSQLLSEKDGAQRQKLGSLGIAVVGTRILWSGALPSQLVRLGRRSITVIPKDPKID